MTRENVIGTKVLNSTIISWYVIERHIIMNYHKGFYPPEGATNRKKAVYSSEFCKRHFLASFEYFKDNKILLNERGFSHGFTEKDLDTYCI